MGEWEAMLRKLAGVWMPGVRGMPREETKPPTRAHAQRAIAKRDAKSKLERRNAASKKVRRKSAEAARRRNR